MKILFRFSFLFLVFAFIPVAYLHAQDAPPVDIVEDDSLPEEELDSEDDSGAEDEMAEESESEEEMEEEMALEDMSPIQRALAMNKKKKAEGAPKGDEEVMTLEELQEFIYSLPAAKDAIDLPISEEASWRKIYDIYSRQLAYRESAKKMRASLEARQVSFAEPRTEIIASYKENLKKIYASERAAYQEELKNQKKNKNKKEPAMKKASVSKGDMAAPKKAAPEKSEKDEKVATAPEAKKEEPKEKIDLKEQEIPAHEGEEEVVKKKVITTEDAPDFDPSNL